MAIVAFNPQLYNLADNTLLTGSNMSPISVITQSATPTIPVQVNSTIPVFGRQSVIQGGAASSTAFARWGVSGAPTSFGITFGIRVSTLPSAATDLMDLRNTASSAKIAGFGINSSNQLQVKNAAGSVPTNGTASTALVASKTYTMKIAIITGSTTTGSIWAWLYDSDGTLVWSFAGSGNQNTGTAGLAQIWCPGKHTASPNMVVAWSWAILDNASSAEPPNIARTLSTVVNVGQTLEPWVMLLLDASSSVAVLGKSAAVWSQVGGTDAVINVPSADVTYALVPASLASKTYTFRRTVTDYDLPTAKTSTADVTHTVLPATESVIIGGTEYPVRIDALFA